MKLSKVLLGSAVLAALMFGFASCSSDEDENDTLDGYSISLTNDGTLTANGKEISDINPAITYARQWNVTHTQHLSADAAITIDRITKSTQVGKIKNATTGNDVTSTDGGNNAAYMFGLKGSGTADKPYSFYLAGFRIYGTTPQYFISYYTGVQTAYINSDYNDFDVDTADNTAYEYSVVEAWENMPQGSYTLTANALTVYIDLDAVYGNENTVVTAANYSVAKTAGIDGYKVTLKPSKEATGVSKTFHASDLKAQSYNKKTAAQSITKLDVDQADIGFYAMVSKDKTLVAKLDFDNDSFVKAAYAGPVDDFGKVIDLNGVELKNF